VRYLSNHIPLEQLADLVNGHITSARRVEFQNHLNVCASCADSFLWLQRLITLMRSDQTENAPAAAIQRAIRIYHPPISTPPISTSPSLRERIIAVLRFDTAQLSLAPGLRSGQSATRQFLFGAGEHDLDVRVTLADGSWQVSGQVLGTEAEGQVVLRNEAVELFTHLNNLGEFDLVPVPAGRYTLLLHLASVDIKVDNLEVGAPAWTELN